MLVGQGDAQVFAAPAEGRCDQAVVVRAEIAPIVFVLAFGDQSIGKAAVAQWAGGVEHKVATTFAAGFTADLRALPVFRLLTDHVDQAARLQSAIEQRGRAFEDFHPLSGGTEVARQAGADAVTQDRAVGVGAETPFDEAVLGAGQGVALAYTADELHRVVERLHLVVRDHLLGDDLHRLCLLHDRHGAFARGTGRAGAVAGLVFTGGGDGLAGQLKWAGGFGCEAVGDRHQGQGEQGEAPGWLGGGEAGRGHVLLSCGCF